MMEVVVCVWLVAKKKSFFFRYIFCFLLQQKEEREMSGGRVKGDVERGVWVCAARHLLVSPSLFNTTHTYITC